MRKNWLTTLAGIMVGLGTLPMLVTAAHVSFPLWWNDLQFPLVLVGLVGGVILGTAAKGVDQHSTADQIAAATVQRQAEIQVKTADAVAPVEAVQVVNPPSVKGIVIPPKPPAKPK